jgi:hypothetical protein
MLRQALASVALALCCGCTGETAVPPDTTAPKKCETLGAWSTWPEADWVRRIVREGGYTVLAETGSALVASGKGHEFFIWAAEGPPSRGMPNWRRLATVRGVPIYGDRDVWRSWRAQGFTFWVQAGPRPVFAPAGGRLAPVVDASLRLPFREGCNE